jgi:hypothetical protein
MDEPLKDSLLCYEDMDEPLKDSLLCYEDMDEPQRFLIGLGYDTTSI